MMEDHRGLRAQIDLVRLKENWLYLKSLVSKGTFLCPMVKANAYGHGSVQVSQVLEANGVEHLGVGPIEEGVQLREAGIQSPLLVFSPFSSSAIPLVYSHRLTPVVSSLEQLQMLAKNKGPALRIHLKFNTGMNRLGFSFDQLKQVQELLAAHPALEVEGLATHLARGEDLHQADSFSDVQMIELRKIRNAFPNVRLIHSHNSAALLREFDETKAPISFGSRPGIALYGLHPYEETSPLKPVMSLEARVLSVQKVKKGQRVSYNGQWTAPRDSLIGVLGLGYGDGFTRFFSNRGVVQCRGHELPVVGIVCMDYTLIDLTDLPMKEDLVGDKVLVFGDSPLDARRISQSIGTIAYEITTCLGSRVPRIYVYEQNDSRISRPARAL